MKSGRRNRRRQLVIQPNLQRRIILQTTMYPIASVGVGTLITGFFCHRLAAEASAVEATLPSLPLLFISVLSFTAAMAGVSLYLALRTSHRIAGPAYRIMQTIRSMRDGDMSVRARLRTGDLLIEVADELNGALDHLEGLEPGERAGAPAEQAAAKTEEAAETATTARD